MVIGGTPGTNTLQVAVHVYKNKREILPGRGAGTDLPSPEAAQLKPIHGKENRSKALRQTSVEFHTLPIKCFLPS